MILNKEISGWILTYPDYSEDMFVTLKKGSSVELIEKDGKIFYTKNFLLSAPDKGKKFYQFIGEIK